MIGCTCAQQTRLWTAVDNPCGKLAENVNLHHVSERDKSLSMRDAVDALVHAVELLAARVEATEYRLDAYWNVIDSPLSPSEALERLRRLREEVV